MGWYIREEVYGRVVDVAYGPLSHITASEPTDEPGIRITPRGVAIWRQMQPDGSLWAPEHVEQRYAELRSK